MVEQILRFDFIITELINNILPHNQFFDAVFSFFSIWGVNTVFWILLAAIWIFFAERKSPGFQKKDRQFIICFTLSILTTAFLVNIVLKNVIKRPRPVLTSFNQLGRRSLGEGGFQLISTNCPSDYSFPSGHAATAFAATAVLSAFDKKRKYFYYFIAFLVALSRIYLGCHYSLDIATGSILGYLIGKLIVLSGNNLSTKSTNNG